MRRSRSLPGMLAAALALLLSACTGLATSGPIEPGLPVDVAVERREFQRLPSGPQADASAEEVLTGFVAAAAISFGDVTVARSYLSDEATEAWVPDGGTVIRETDAPLTVRPLGRGRYRISSPEVARIDGQGRLTLAPRGTVSSATVQLGRVDGQWRITGIPRGFGRWMTQSEVDARLRPFDLHYLGSGGTTLIPARRWFALPGIVSRLTQEQLAGPPAHLIGAVPDDPPVRLDGDVVPVNSGVATVPVRAGDVVADPVRRRRLYAELVATLTQVRGLPGVDDVVSVAITADGTLLDADGVKPPVSGPSEVGASLDPPAAEATPLLRRGSRLYPVTFDTLVGDADGTSMPMNLPALPRAARRPALSGTGREVAYLDGARPHLHRLRTAGASTVAGLGVNLTQPVYDRHDWLWVGGSTSNGSAAIWAIDAGADPAQWAVAHRVPVPWLRADRVVRSVRVSPEGQRVAVVTADRAGRNVRVEIGGVVRRDDGRPLRLSDESRLTATRFTDVTDVVWISMATLGVLGRMPGEQVPRGAVVEIGGSDTVLGSLSGASGITSFGSRRSLVLTGPDGPWTRAGTGWSAVTVGEDVLVPLR